MNHRFLLVLAAAALFSGCEDMAERVRDRGLVGAPTPRSRTVPADPRATYDAAKLAVAKMGFTYVRGGPAQGIVEAMGPVMSGDSPGSAHQYLLRAQLRPSTDGSGTEVTARLSEVIEADSNRHPGQGTEAPLRDTGLYEVFFRTLQESLPPAH